MVSRASELVHLPPVKRSGFEKLRERTDSHANNPRDIKLVHSCEKSLKIYIIRLLALKCQNFLEN